MPSAEKTAPPGVWGKKPVPKAPDLDKFVRGGASKGETTRLNANIPTELHKRVKAQCALDGLDMTKVLIELLEQRFPAR